MKMKAMHVEHPSADRTLPFVGETPMRLRSLLEPTAANDLSMSHTDGNVLFDICFLPPQMLLYFLYGGLGVRLLSRSVFFILVSQPFRCSQCSCCCVCLAFPYIARLHTAFRCRARRIGVHASTMTWSPDSLLLSAHRPPVRLPIRWHLDAVARHRGAMLLARQARSL